MLKCSSAYISLSASSCLFIVEFLVQTEPYTAAYKRQRLSCSLREAGEGEVDDVTIFVKTFTLRY